MMEEGKAPKDSGGRRGEVLGGLTSDCESEVGGGVPPRISYLKTQAVGSEEGKRRRKKKARKARRLSSTSASASVVEDSAMETESVVEAGKARKRTVEEVAPASSSGPDALVAKKALTEPSSSSKIVKEARVVLLPLPADAVVAAGSSGSVPKAMGPPVARARLTKASAEVKSAASTGAPSRVQATAGSAGASASAKEKPAPPVRQVEEDRGLSLASVLAKFSDIKRMVVSAIGHHPEAGVAIAEISSQYEELLIGLAGTLERHRGRGDSAVGASEAVEKTVRSLGVPVGIRVQERPSFAQVASAATVSGGVGGKIQVEKPDIEPAKPVETWSLVVKGKQGESVGALRKKVVEELVPAVGVRVHTVRPGKQGGILVRTPSVAERDAFLGHKKLEEVGLLAEAARGKSLVVQRVEKRISPEEFLGELHKLNLCKFTKQEFEEEVSLSTPSVQPKGRGYPSRRGEVLH